MMLSWRPKAAWLPLVLGVALTASCSSEREAVRASETTKVAAPATEAAGRHVHPAANLGSAMRDVKTGFTRHGGTLATEGTAYEATVSARGALAISPFSPLRAAALGPVNGARAQGAPLTLETVRIARGTFETVGPGNVFERDGAAVVIRGDVEEILEDDAVGIEQSWRFARAPPGNGNLEVRVRATGERYVTTTAHGLHFGDASASLGLRYGTATWVDANGTRTVIEPRFDGTDIVLRVPQAVVDTSRYPAVLDPTVTPEQELDKPAQVAPASGDRSYPLIARAPANGGYLGVWYDRRGVRPSFYGSRVAANGTPTTETGFIIAGGVTPSTTPLLASASVGYLLVWSVSYYDIYQQPGVYAVRVDPQGAPLDAQPVLVASNEGSVYSLSAAYDGTSWLVAWQRYTSSTTLYDVRGTRVPAQGAPDAKVLDLAKTAEYEDTPVVLPNANNGFLLVYRTRQNVSPYNATISTRTVSKDGVPAANATVLLSQPNLYELDATTSGAQHILAYNRGDDQYALRIGNNGAAVGAPINVSVVPNVYDHRPRIMFDGTNFLQTFMRGQSVMGARISPAGALLDAAPFTLATGNSYYDRMVASDGTGTVLVHSEYVLVPNQPSRAEIRLTPFSKPAAPNAPVAGAVQVLSKAANAEQDAAVAFNGNSHYAVWIDSREANPTIWGSMISGDGQPAEPVKLLSNPNGATTYSQLGRPRIAFGGDHFLVTFFASAQSATPELGIYGLLLDVNGALVGGVRKLSVNDPSQQPFATEREPDVAFDGTNFLVVYEQDSNDGNAIAGRRIAPDGISVDPASIRLSPRTQSGQRRTPALAFDGNSYFIAWVTSRPTASIDVTHIFGTRVGTDTLTALDGETVVCDAFLLQRSPQVAADKKNGGFFVVWEDNRTALESADVYGARITRDGVNVEGPNGMKISNGKHDEARPRVAASGDGTNWVVAWRDFRSKHSYDVYGAWISLAGKVHDPDGFLLSAEGGDEEAPVLSPAAAGKLLLTYQRLDPSAGSYRLRSRIVQSGALVASPCTKNDDCASRSCVDGVCCSTECAGCGVCNATPGTCTPRAEGTETDRCASYKCKGTLECPTKCENDADCAARANCDPATKTCVSRVLCIDSHTLKDVTGKLTDCAPFNCIADACRTQCGSVDDCAAGFVCDYGGRCVPPPGSGDLGCSVSSDGHGGGTGVGVVLVGVGWAFASALRRRVRKTQP